MHFNNLNKSNQQIELFRLELLHRKDTIMSRVSLVAASLSVFIGAQGIAVGQDELERSNFNLAPPEAVGNLLDGAGKKNSPPKEISDLPSISDTAESALSRFDESDGELDFLVESKAEDFPAEETTMQLVEKATVIEHGPNGKVERPFFQTTNATIKLNVNLAEYFKGDLSASAKRTAVLTVAARRHLLLIEQLKEAKPGSEQDKVLEALRKNYAMHYGVECWWRKQKLDELESQVAELKTKLKQRVDSQEAYVKAAMTIADLYADGVSAPPPVPAMPVGAIGPAPNYYPTLNAVPGGTNLNDATPVYRNGYSSSSTNRIPSNPLPSLENAQPPANSRY